MGEPISVEGLRAFHRTEKAVFMETIRSFVGRPYRWGGDDPSGIDCSGLVVEGLKAAGRLYEGDDLTADAIWRKWQGREIDHAREGAFMFAFNDKGKATHVVVCRDGFYGYGAEGGGASVLSEHDAWLHNAFVKIRPIHRRKRVRFVYIWHDIEGSE